MLKWSDLLATNLEVKILKKKILSQRAALISLSVHFIDMARNKHNLVHEEKEK